MAIVPEHTPTKKTRRSQVQEGFTPITTGEMRALGALRDAYASWTYTVLKSWAWGSNQARPSATALAERAGLDVKTVRAALDRLEGVGLVVVDHQPGFPSCYRLTLIRPVRLVTGLPAERRGGSTRQADLGLPVGEGGSTRRTGNETNKTNKRSEENNTTAYALLNRAGEGGLDLSLTFLLRLLKIHHEDKVKAAIELALTRPMLKNPAGFITKAIEGGWTPTKAYEGTPPTEKGLKGDCGASGKNAPPEGVTAFRVKDGSTREVVYEPDSLPYWISRGEIPYIDSHGQIRRLVDAEWSRVEWLI